MGKRKQDVVRTQGSSTLTELGGLAALQGNVWSVWSVDVNIISLGGEVVWCGRLVKGEFVFGPGVPRVDEDTGYHTIPDNR
jgi:hypothetical protein